MRQNRWPSEKDRLDYKTVTLTVQEDGSVYIAVESSFYVGEKITVLPKTAGVPTPHEWYNRVPTEASGKGDTKLLKLLRQMKNMDMKKKRWNAIFSFRMIIFDVWQDSKDADFHVSKDEINVIEAFMIEELELDPDARKMAIECFNEGKTTEVPFKEIAAEFVQNEEDMSIRRWYTILARKNRYC